MIRYLLLVLLIALISGRTLGLDFGLAPGISIKNALLYLTAAAIALESALAQNRKVEILPVIIPFAILVAYATMSWAIVVLLLERPFYDPLQTLIRLKTKLVDHFLVLLVFYYGLVNARVAYSLIKTLMWVMIFGCLVTIVDSFNIPDLGIVTTNTKDGGVEGFVGSTQNFGGVLAFILPSFFALWWTQVGSKKAIALIGVAAGLVCLLLTGSRGAMVGLFAGIVASAVLFRHHISPRIFVRVFVTLVFLTPILAALVLSSDFGDVLRSQADPQVTTGNLESISSGRTRIWANALSAMAEQPISFILGLGWEAYYERVSEQSATHSVYLDRFYNLGAIGLFLFVQCFLGVIATLRQSLQKAQIELVPFLMAISIGVIAYMLSMAFSDTHSAGLLVWAFVGLALRVANTAAGDAQSNAFIAGNPRPYVA